MESEVNDGLYLASVTLYCASAFWWLGCAAVIDHDKPVRVFRNLTHGCYSILQNGRLKASARQVLLCDVEFRVRESGRQRMLKDNARNVHAFAVGRLIDYVHAEDSRELALIDGRTVTYNPHQLALFYDEQTLIPVISAEVVHLGEEGVLYA